ncbi:PepSY domain-containing protein [Hyphomicrobium sp.]|uniref:PepSY-associated TM helix domain-containing protein n=1 Tax=Hyphomicrobium sp. TaxID=82 RepID=UPI000FAC3A0B|nr:PepSY-associated TM helix domain-containing protein [Hyphomicrobium sp.]RUP00362.1 MAG: PepSY domain-containing protein [Hyphomicrobium sp.]
MISGMATSGSAATVAGSSGRIRWMLRFLHRTLGHTLGIVFVVIGLTGSMLAYWQAIDEALNPGVLLVAASPPEDRQYRPIDQIMSSAKAAMKPGGEARILIMPRHENAAALVLYEIQRSGGVIDLHEIGIDPYTATTVGQRAIQEDGRTLSMPFIQILMSLHSALLLNEGGEILVAVIATFMIISIIAGIYLWWPRNGNWRQAITIKRGASPARRIFDVHRVTGAWTSIVLIAMLFTGTYVIIRQVMPSLLSFVAGSEKPLDSYRSAASLGATISPGDAVKRAEEALPGGKLYSLSLPQNREGVYIVGRQSVEEPNRAATYRNVVVDQFSGAVLTIQDRDKFSAGETFNEWVYPLHCGEAFGNFGRGVVMLLGIVPALLYFTALARWLNKRRATSK